MNLFSWLNDIHEAKVNGENSEESSEPPLSPILRARLEELEKISVREIMIPRALIFALDADVQLKRIRRIKSSKSAYFPVYKGDLDHVLGWVSKAKVLELAALPGAEDVSLTDHIRPIGRVDEGVSIADLADIFLKASSPFLVVKNSHGGTVGIVELGDFVEQIFGFDLDSSPVAISGPDISLVRNQEL